MLISGGNQAIGLGGTHSLLLSLPAPGPILLSRGSLSGEMQRWYTGELIKGNMSHHN